MNFGTPNTNSNDGSVGNVYTYPGVFTKNGITVDGKVTVLAKTNTTVLNMDQNLTVAETRFEPGLKFSAAGDIRLRFDFVDRATGQPIFLKDFYLTVYDLGANNSFQEYVEISGFASYTLDQSTQITAGSGANGRTRFTGSWTDASGIQANDQNLVIANYTAPVSTMDLVLGGTAAYSSSTRNYSVNFGLPGWTFTTPITTPNGSSPTIAITSAAATYNPTPTISGTTNAGDGRTVTVDVNGKSYATTVTGTTWSVPVPSQDELAGNTYPVTASVTDVNGNPGTTTQNLTVNKRPTTTVVACNDSTLPVNSSTSCTVTVTDTSNASPVLAVAGTATLTTTKTGSFSGPCNLSNGTCTVTYTATGAGAHVISASYGGSSWHLTSASSGASNATVTVKAPQSGFTLAVPASITYGNTGTATTGGGSGTGAVSYSAGSSTGCTVNASTGVITVTDASGTCAISATKAGDSTYSPATDGPKTVTLVKANATITVTGYNVTYDGNPHTATGTATGVNSEDLGALLTLGGTTHTSVGTYNNDPWSFAGNNNYNAANGTVNNSISAAGQTGFTLMVPASITYGNTGTAITSGGSGTGAVTYSSGSSTGCTVDPTTGLITVTDASGTCAITATKAGDGTYNAATDGPKMVTLNKANATITVTGYNVTYDGNPYTATGTATGVSNEDLSALLNLSGTTHTNVGTYTDTWSFAGNNNYNATNGTVNNTVSAAGQSGFTLTVPASVTYGDTGTANTTGGQGTGAVTYSADSSTGCAVDPTTGLITVTDASGTCVITATKAGDGTYNAATDGPKTVTLNKANATITVTGYNVTYDGNAHTAIGTATGVNNEDLSALLTLGGTTHTSVGAYTDTWTFAGNNNYNAASGTVNNSISAAEQTGFTLAVPASITYGNTGTATTSGGQGTGAVTYSAGSSTGCTVDPTTGLITVTDASGTCEITATKAGDGNYNAATDGPKTVALVKANATITVTGYNVTYDGNPHTATGTATGVNSEDLGALLTLTGTTHTNVGTYNNDPWSFAGNNNYNAANGTVNSTIAADAVLVGTVKTDAGFEVVGIKLYLVNSDGQTVAETTTGVGGAYRFESLPGGTYTVKVKSVETPLAQAMKAVPGIGETTLDIVIPATATLRLVANPATIVGNGRSTSQLQSELRLLDNTLVSGVEVIFSATAGTLTEADARTSADGKANATLKAPIIEGIDKVVREASVRVQDVERGLFAFTKIQITFAPSSIDGVVLDNGTPRKPIAGATVLIHKDFGDGNIFDAEAVTDAQGRYSIIVPKGNTTYEAEITIPVTVNGVKTSITTMQTAVVGQVSGTGDVTPATKTVSGQLFAPDPKGGGVKTIDQVLGSGQRIVGTLIKTGETEGAPVSVDAHGAFRAENVAPGTYVAVFQIQSPGKGPMLTGVRVPFTVSADGELTIGTGLIDPFGRVTDKATGLPIEGVRMELRWADTPLNISKSRTPHAAILLPELVTFLPNQNHVPQLTTVGGEYAWMVFADGDYYIVTTKSGYQTYDSRTEGRNVPVKPGEDSYVTNGVIHVGTTIVHYDLQMSAQPPAPPAPVTPPIPQGKIVGKLLFIEVNGGAPKPLTAAQAQSLTASLETAEGQPVNKPVTIDASGSYEVKDLAAGSYRILFRSKGADGRPLAVTAATVPVKVAGEPELQTTVIDPFRTVRDAATGKPLQGVLVSLLWADTPLNRNAGRTPGTLVILPGQADFAPHGNANPHYTNELGRYGAFCLPQGDYYVVAKKDGYLPYDSRNDARTISLGAGDSMKEGILHVSNGGCAVDFELEPMKLEVLPQYTRYILGYPDGTFKAERAVTRAEVAAIFSRLMGTDLAKLQPVNLKDLPATHWASRYVAAVMAKGLMKGDPSGEFRPDAPITRAELATVIVRYKGLPMGRTGIFQDTAGHWAEPYISAAFQGGIVLGYTDNTFAPTQTTKRAELVAMVNRMLGWAQLMTGKSEPRWPDVPFTYWGVRHIEKASITHTAKPGADQLDYLIEVLPDGVQ